MLTTDCRTHLVVCSHCSDSFISEGRFQQHINRKSNPQCREAHVAQNKMSNFTTSQVAVPWNTAQSELSYTDYKNMTDLEIIHHQASKSISKDAPMAPVKLENAIVENLQYDSDGSVASHPAATAPENDMDATIYDGQNQPESGDDFDENIFLSMKEKQEQETSSVPEDSEYKVSLHLLKML